MRFVIPALTLLLTACSPAEIPESSSNELVSTAPRVVGKWIRTSSGDVMEDPQTSALATWRGQLVSISDGSAIDTYQRKVHILEAANARLMGSGLPMRMAKRVRRSCFGQYLGDKPDLEALVVDPQDDSVMYVVTEDATRTGALSTKCQTRFEDTGSTDYPTLLVRLKIDQDNQGATMTHVRPLRFAKDDEVGNFPNDGIEGLAITSQRKLYLGLEKDKRGRPRIFEVMLFEKFWEKTGFANVTDSELDLPALMSGNHPINGLTWYQHQASHEGFLIAAARNDDELWILDTTKERPSTRVPLTFAAQNQTANSMCPADEVLDNTSIEGLTVLDSTLYIVNDPWKRNYKKNITCDDNADGFERMAPLLFALPLDPDWFE